jgi:hypothetical protein
MKKYAILYWDVKDEKMKKFNFGEFIYLTEQQFYDGEWDVKGFELDMDDFIEEDGTKN